VSTTTEGEKQTGKAEKTRRVYTKEFKAEAEVRGSVFMYLEAYYNRVRMHPALDYVAPDGFNSGRAA
jgi:transposase InsO family protein